MIYPVNAFFSADNDKLKMYTTTFMKSVLSHPLLLEMDNTFWGWPIFEDIGGINVLRYLENRDLWEAVSHVDKHPNKETHENIAKFILENL